MPSNNHGKAYLAFDLGAESGRAVLAHLRSGVLKIEEIHRFPNKPIECDGSLHWDVRSLWFEMRQALTRLEKVELESIGVDAWGVDYALLGERGELLQDPYHYRDRRTAGVMEEVIRKLPKHEIYQATGIQFMRINTLYQLFAARRADPKLFAAAKQLITIPDLFHYWLSGNAVCEFTNATTTQMVDPVTRTWATGLMQRLELPSGLPSPTGRAWIDSRDASARDRRAVFSCGNDSDCSRLSRHGFGGGSDLGSQWHSVSQFWNLVAGGD